MERNKISIVLPVYNGGKYVGDAIRSVLGQTYGNIELIIVNDCSQDNTFHVISQYAEKDDRIKIINNETNQKLPRSLNIGFAEASGEYFTWTSDDNRYHKDALQRMADILDRINEIDLVYADFSIVDMQGKLIKEIKEGEPGEIRFRDNIGACFLYRRSLAEKAGEYNPDAFLAEDYEFFIRCYKYGDFFHIDEDLYDYGSHEANLTATRQKDIAHQAFYVMNMHFDFLYSECHTQEDINRFFYELLALLRDPNERKQYRRKYYRLNKKFACTDIRKRVLENVKRIPGIPRKLVRKILKKNRRHIS